MVHDHTSYDLHHFADDTVLADDRLLDTRLFTDLGGVADHRIARDLCLGVNERTAFGVGRQGPRCLAEELRGSLSVS